MLPFLLPGPLSPCDPFLPDKLLSLEDFRPSRSSSLSSDVLRPLPSDLDPFLSAELSSPRSSRLFLWLPRPLDLRDEPSEFLLDGSLLSKPEELFLLPGASS